jgi:hypothetical protein
MRLPCLPLPLLARGEKLAPASALIAAVKSIKQTTKTAQIFAQKKRNNKEQRARIYFRCVFCLLFLNATRSRESR